MGQGSKPDVSAERFSHAQLLELALRVPLQRLHWPALDRLGIEVQVRRDDLAHPALNGNKLYKLWYNLGAAAASGQQTLLSFGGAWSNHIHALAAAGAVYGYRTVGVIRGEPSATPSATLQDAEAAGMQLHFVSRADYRRKQDPQFQRQLQAQFGDFAVLPEGGTNLLGARGCEVIAEATDRQLDYDAICLPCASGGSLAGIAAALAPGRRAYGISVLKGGGGLEEDVATLARKLLYDKGRDRSASANWTLVKGYHGGGYARLSAPLLAFMQRFERDAGLLLDPVYTAKLFWAIEAMALEGHWQRGTRLVAVHTGGLQGRRGYAALKVANTQ